MLLPQPINKLRLALNAGRTNPSAKRAGHAFTLVELLLATTLVLLLAGGLIFSFANLLRSTQLEEGAGRLEGVIRFARAQAASTGRKVQIVFEPDAANTSDPSGSTIRLNWETDPLDQPGRFEELTDAAWQVQGFSDLVNVKDVQLLQPTGAKICHHKSGDEKMLREEELEAWLGEPFSTITFYPDGSSDSAEIILVSRVPEEEQQISVRLVGMTGSISHRPVTATESESQLESQQPEEGGVAPKPK